MKHADRFCFEQCLIAHIKCLCVALKEPILLDLEDGGLQFKSALVAVLLSSVVATG